MASARIRSSGVVSFMLVFSPLTTSTRPPAASTGRSSTWSRPLKPSGSVSFASSARETEPEGLRGLDHVELRPVEGFDDGPVRHHLDGVRDGERGDDAVRGAVPCNQDDALYQLPGY